MTEDAQPHGRRHCRRSRTGIDLNERRATGVRAGELRLGYAGTGFARREWARRGKQHRKAEEKECPNCNSTWMQ
ncbi:hypothetical protein IF2G_09274 [Cordyceps javanica]|nr:hypothetical protein IF2G_09274 [Cordyceps javanica]